MHVQTDLLTIPLSNFIIFERDRVAISAGSNFHKKKKKKILEASSLAISTKFDVAISESNLIFLSYTDSMTFFLKILAEVWITYLICPLWVGAQ